LSFEKPHLLVKKECQTSQRPAMEREEKQKPNGESFWIPYFGPFISFRHYPVEDKGTKGIAVASEVGHLESLISTNP